LDRKWTNIIIWPRDRASISVQQLHITYKGSLYRGSSTQCTYAVVHNTVYKASARRVRNTFSRPEEKRRGAQRCFSLPFEHVDNGHNIRVFVYHLFSSIDSVSSWPGALFQNRTYWVALCFGYPKALRVEIWKKFKFGKVQVRKSWNSKKLEVRKSSSSKKFKFEKVKVSSWPGALFQNRTATVALCFGYLKALWVEKVWKSSSSKKFKFEKLRLMSTE
jgi:hypothetical protein